MHLIHFLLFFWSWVPALGKELPDLARRCPVYVSVKVVHSSLLETSKGSCKNMNDCVVAEKTLVVIKETVNHVQLTQTTGTGINKIRSRWFRVNEYWRYPSLFRRRSPATTANKLYSPVWVDKSNYIGFHHCLGCWLFIINDLESPSIIFSDRNTDYMTQESRFCCPTLGDSRDE